MAEKRSICEKSTGQLVDELVTNAFKTGSAACSRVATSEYDARYEDLREALIQRLGQDVSAQIHDLALVSMATWHSQELVMHEQSDQAVATAGRHSQRTNAIRARIIREIDRLLGEAGISITTKTYG